LSLGPPGCDKRGGGGVAEVLRTAACGAAAAVAGAAVAGAAVAGAGVAFTIGLFDTVFLFFFFSEVFSEDNVDSAISEVLLSFSFASFDDPFDFDSSLLSDFTFCFLSFEQHPQKPPFFWLMIFVD